MQYIVDTSEAPTYITHVKDEAIEHAKQFNNARVYVTMTKGAIDVFARYVHLPVVWVSQESVFSNMRRIKT